jgi:DNA-binding Lrp family transcriptional regulator
MEEKKQLITGKTLKILRILFEKASFSYAYMADVDQNSLAKELKITRQALNIHLRKLKNLGLIRTGRGFIEITIEGLKIMGFSGNMALVFLKVKPSERSSVYKKLSKMPIWQAFRITGELDIFFLVEADRLNKILKQISEMSGIEQTRTYITIEMLK